MNKNAALLTLVLALCGAGRAKADLNLLTLINPPVQSNTPYSLSFFATGPNTQVSIGGYQLPSFEQVTDITLTATGGSGNLLGQTWNFVPAASGSLANQYDDMLGTGTNALNFGGVTEGDYDVFDQSFGSTAGQGYTLNFNFTEEPGVCCGGVFIGPSGFEVDTTGTGAVAPEPALMLPLTALLGLGYVARKRFSNRANS